MDRTQLDKVLSDHKLWLSGAGGSRADLSSADLSSAHLSFANLSFANLSSADLRSADLSFANLSCPYLNRANLSGAVGLLSASAFMAKFVSNADGVLVYKRIGQTNYSPPTHWKIQAGSVLTEVANPDRCTICGSGVNFGTLAWCKKYAIGSELWLCRIAWADLPGVVVPYNTDGKARCERLTLIEVVNPENTGGKAE